MQCPWPAGRVQKITVCGEWEPAASAIASMTTCPCLLHGRVQSVGGFEGQVSWELQSVAWLARRVCKVFKGAA